MTENCNARCRHCLLGQRNERVTGELTIDEIEKVSASMGDMLFFTPTGGEPFNSTDRDTTNLNLPGQEQNVDPDPANLIVSGQPSAMYIIFYSAGGGPLPTPFGNAGLDLPVVGIQAALLNEQGYALVPVVPPVGWAGYHDFYIHVLGTSASGQPVWSVAGNNPNGTGSIEWTVN